MGSLLHFTMASVSKPTEGDQAYIGHKVKDVLWVWHIITIFLINHIHYTIHYK